MQVAQTTRSPLNNVQPGAAFQKLQFFAQTQTDSSEVNRKTFTDMNLMTQIICSCVGSSEQNI